MIRHDLLQDWAVFERRIRPASRVCVLCDYDGTLAPIAARPGLVELPPESAAALAGLSRRKDVVLGVVSGRAMSDLRHRIPVANAWLVGNHGFEIRPPGSRERRLFSDADERRILECRDALARRLAGIPGLLLEPKGPILAVHYREIAATRVRDVQEAVLELLRRTPGLSLATGDRVMELMARPDRTKGSAVGLIRSTLPPGSVTVYFGDDRSDLEAFRELEGRGVRVAVRGLLTRHSDYVLDDYRGVAEALRRLARSRRRRNKS